MPIEISEIEFNENCQYCKETMKGFIVFGKHTPRKKGGDVDFTEYLLKKRTEGTAEILTLLVTGHCTSCNINNMFKCDYNLEKGTYEVQDISF
jgi:hypothetical protein